MKRYMNLIRSILEYVECQEPDRLITHPEVNGYTPQQVKYHVGLCEEAGFIACSDGSGLIQRLTWHGHEELCRFRKQ